MPIRLGTFARKHPSLYGKMIETLSPTAIRHGRRELSAAKPASGSQVSERRSEGMDSSGIGTRRTGKIGGAQIFSAPSFGKRSRVASGLDLFWDDDRFVRAELVGAAAGEITPESVFQQYDRTFANDSQPSGVSSDDFCFPQLRPQAGAAIPCGNSGHHGSSCSCAVGHDSFPILFADAVNRPCRWRLQLPPPFWALPTEFLTGFSAAAGIALINSVGNLGAFAGPYMIGAISPRERGTSTEAWPLLGSRYS
jgi:hypothetical protein